MGKLSSLKPRLQPLGSRLSTISRDQAEAERLRVRDQSVAWRAWYKTSRWQKLRMQILTRDLFTCQWVGCGKIEHNTSLLVADHKTPHRGNPVLFWDESNLQCLCKPCHDKLKQRLERAGPAW